MKQKDVDRKNGVKENPSLWNNQIPVEYRSIHFLDRDENTYLYKQWLNLDFSVVVPKSECYRGEETTFVSSAFSDTISKKWKRYADNKGS